MRRPILLSALLALLFSIPGLGQKDDAVLLKVNGYEVTAGEFTRLYKKSNPTNEKEDFNKYFEQFVTFRLKVAQAQDEGLDTLESFRNEFAGYRNQLANNYLTDNEAREKLITGIYNRLLTEINASHILVACPADATPEDTLKAYNKCLELNARLLQGEPFELVARGGSDDPSVVANGGNLGYFSAMQMILPFEDVAYNLKAGTVSPPVRTPYGYHLIKVHGRRPSRGTIRTAHIMKAVPEGASAELWKKAGDEIEALHKRLLDGESFSELAKAESDHRESATNGGELAWFGTGDIVHEYADAAFALEKDGDFSAPVKTVYGWHIIMRLEKKPIGSLEENRSTIESRHSSGRINSIARNSLVSKLKTQYKYSLNKENLNTFISLTDTLISKSGKKINRQMIPRGNLFTFTGGSLSCEAFATHVENNLGMFNGSNTASVITSLLDVKVSELILGYEDSRLEEKYPDFRYLVKEFHDGMLLFEINSREVWNKAASDTIALQKFYEANKELFMGNPSAYVKIYSLKVPDKIKTLTKLVSRFGSKKGGDEKIISRYIVHGDTTLALTTGRIYRGDDPSLDKFLSRKGTNAFSYHGLESVIRVIQVYPAEPLLPEDVHADLTALFQDHLEERWLAQLKKKYTVWVDEKVKQEIRERYYEKN
jgi:peptidyl-prolyl cis-trans isomerase SurA